MAESIPVIGGQFNSAGGVDHSRNKRLFVGSLDRDKTTEDVLRALKELVTGVMNVIMYPSQQNQAQNRGYAFVEFDTHENAVRARDELRKSPPRLWGGSQIKVDWAEPENEVDDETMSKVKVLFVRKLATETTEDTLRREFQRFGPLERVKRQNDHAFIHFLDRQHADNARRSMNNTTLDGCSIEVVWSKPVNREQQRLNRRNRPVAAAPIYSVYLPNGMQNHMLPSLGHVPAPASRIENPAAFYANSMSLFGGEPLIPQIGAPVKLPPLAMAPPHLPAPFEPQPQLPGLSNPTGLIMEEPPRAGHPSHQPGGAPGAVRSSIAPQVDTRPYPVPSAVQQQQQQIQLQQTSRHLAQYPQWSPVSYVAPSLPVSHVLGPGLYTGSDQLTGLEFSTVNPHIASGFSFPYLPVQTDLYAHAPPYAEN